MSELEQIPFHSAFHCLSLLLNPWSHWYSQHACLECLFKSLVLWGFPAMLNDFAFSLILKEYLFIIIAKMMMMMTMTKMIPMVWEAERQRKLSPRWFTKQLHIMPPSSPPFSSLWVGKNSITWAITLTRHLFWQEDVDGSWCQDLTMNTPCGTWLSVRLNSGFLLLLLIIILVWFFYWKLLLFLRFIYLL